MQDRSVIYLVIANKPDDHLRIDSYIVGAFSDAGKASAAADSEERDRGGLKFECEIIELELDCAIENAGFESPPIIARSK